VYVGDNGQRDLKAAEDMAFYEVNENGASLEHAFIHDVTRDGQVSLLNSPYIHFFETYYDAARKAFSLGLISLEGVQNVQDAFENSGIVRICQNQELFSGGYPCIDIENRRLLNSATMEALPKELGGRLFNNLPDGTTIIQDCSRISAGLSQIQPIEPPYGGYSRCDDIRRVMESQDWKMTRR